MYYTFSSAKNCLPLQVIPRKFRHFLPCDEEIACPLGELGKIHDIIIGPFIIGINGRFRPHETDIRFAGEDGGHHFVSSESTDKLQPDIFIFKIAFFDGHIHGRVKNGVGDFVQCHVRQLFLGGRLRSRRRFFGIAGRFLCCFFSAGR